MKCSLRLCLSRVIARLIFRPSDAKSCIISGTGSSSRNNFKSRDSLIAIHGEVKRKGTETTSLQNEVVLKSQIEAAERLHFSRIRPLKSAYGR